MSSNADTATKLFIYLTSLSVLIVFAVTGYIFLYERDYSFYVETECDPATATCFIRDCTEADSCPPNGLEQYRAFYIKAYDFKKCESGSCLTTCTTDSASCEEVLCGDDPADTCLIPEPIVTATTSTTTTP